MLHNVLLSMRRCKTLSDRETGSKLARVLNLLDLTALGVGSTLGLGVYVLAGAVAKTVAGPAVCISFLIAAIASAFAGLCYAEFAARVPKAGSAYVYSYVTVGEFVAFTIGWNLILEYVIATASVAKGTANYIDSLFNNTMQRTMTRVAPISIPHLTEYPDFLALSFVLLTTVLLATGVKESTKLNNIFTLLNTATVLTVVIGGAFYANDENWKIKSEDIPEAYRDVAGTGGFMPFGFAGIMAGAAKCFFGFVGFDCVATTGEEARNPQRDIPLSILLSLVIIFLAYFSMSTVITLMWPYYLQDADAPFPYVFGQVGLPAIKWIVTIGAIFALCTSLLGSIFPLPRVIYAMSSDGVLFKPLAQINAKTKTPVLATVVSGCFAGVMATLFELNQLIEMLSIGTLLAYTIVAISVLIMRYEFDGNGAADPVYTVKDSRVGVLEVVKQALSCNRARHPTFPTFLSAAVAKSSISAFFLLSLLASVAMSWLSEPWGYPMLGVFGLFSLLCVVVLCCQPRQPTSNIFTVPLVPLLPCLSIFINLYLMVQLDKGTWIRFVVWLVIGYAIYFGYGIQNSTLGEKRKTPNKSDGRNALAMTEDKIKITQQDGYDNKAFVNNEEVLANKNESKNDIFKINDELERRNDNTERSLGKIRTASGSPHSIENKLNKEFQDKDKRSDRSRIAGNSEDFKINNSNSHNIRTNSIDSNKTNSTTNFEGNEQNVVKQELKYDLSQDRER